MHCLGELSLSALSNSVNHVTLTHDLASMLCQWVQPSLLPKPCVAAHTDTSLQSSSNESEERGGGSLRLDEVIVN